MTTWFPFCWRKRFLCSLSFVVYIHAFIQLLLPFVSMSFTIFLTSENGLHLHERTNKCPRCGFFVSRLELNWKCTKKSFSFRFTKIQWSAFHRKLECTSFITLASVCLTFFRSFVWQKQFSLGIRCIVINNSACFCWINFSIALSELQNTVMWYTRSSEFIILS